MTYKFKTLTEEQKNEMLVSTLQAQEVDLYMHTINLERFQAIANDPNLPDSDFKQKVTNEIPVLEGRIAEVSSIIKHLEPQLPDEATLAVTVSAIKEKTLLAK